MNPKHAVPPIDLDDLGGENVVELDHEEIIIENDLVEENGIEEENDIVALAPVDDDPVEVVGERTDHHFFMVDTETCAEETNEAYLEKEEGELSSISFSLNASSSSLSQGNGNGKEKRRSNVTCFNCLGEHTVSQCPDPIDQARINRNRDNMFGNRNFFNGPRFHEKSEKKFEPGVIGDDLRAALGIGERDIPPWIFRLRKKGFIDGYPPGYRSKAIEKSTLTFFMTEEEEKDSAAASAKNDVDNFVFDPTKVIRYPGFNCEDRRLQDPEARHYRAPPWHIYMAAFEQHVADLNRRAAEGRRIRVGGEIASSEQKKANRKQIEEAPSNSRDAPPAVCKQVATTNEPGGGGEGAMLPPPLPPPFPSEAPPAAKRGRHGEENNPAADDLEDGEVADDEDLSLSSVNSLNTEKEEENGKGKKKKNQEFDSVSLGTISQVSYGTPIPLQRHISQDTLNHEFVKPSLEKWAQDIQPFQHSEEPKAENRGFLNRMKSLIKGLGIGGNGNGGTSNNDKKIAAAAIVDKDKDKAGGGRKRPHTKE